MWGGGRSKVYHVGRKYHECQEASFYNYFLDFETKFINFSQLGGITASPEHENSTVFVKGMQFSRYEVGAIG